ncbi:hypothetical protein BXA17_20030, partial [Acinetobacter baumannii]|uniref:hypothetical protein n=1 Tax=Acinetobacter baumannii TaxID=470 RepID=UPI000B718571
DNDKLKKVLTDILATPISPELVSEKAGEITQKTEDIIGPYELLDFFIYHLKNKKLVAGLVLATMVLTGKYLHDQAFVGVEKKVTIKNSKVKSDLKITHIS